MESLSCRCRVRGPQMHANADKSNKQKLAFQHGAAQPRERARERTRERARVPTNATTPRGFSSSSETTNKGAKNSSSSEATPTHVHEAGEDEAGVAGCVRFSWPFFTGTIKVLGLTASDCSDGCWSQISPQTLSVVSARWLICHRELTLTAGRSLCRLSSKEQRGLQEVIKVIDLLPAHPSAPFLLFQTNLLVRSQPFHPTSPPSLQPPANRC